MLTVLLQVYVARFAEGTAAAIRLLMLSGALMALCCGFFAAAQATSALSFTRILDTALPRASTTARVNSHTSRAERSFSRT